MSTPRQRSSVPSRPTKRKSKTTVSPRILPQISKQRPADDDRDGWHAHWQAEGQPWRTEPEIDQKRQGELERRRAVLPDIVKGIYPFKDVKLNRADVEWLLATHENGRGPVDWGNANQRQRHGLDLRGADLRQMDLHGLPLACLRGGLDGSNWVKASQEQRNMAKLHLDGADLSCAHLEHAFLAGVSLEKANLFRSHLEKADLYAAHLEGAYLRETHLEGASLRGVFFDAATSLPNVLLGNEEYGVALLSNIHWGETSLSEINWAQIKALGDEQEAKQPTMWFGDAKNKHGQLMGYQRAVRANRLLAIALQNQGLNEDATRFAYRAQILQRQVFKRQRYFGKWLFSWFLFFIAGYGYKPSRSFLAYFLIISLFATIYYILGHTVGPTLSPLGAFVFSMTSFHGRGFFPGNNISLDDPLTVLAALEALVGLIIEVTLIATLTQRFFNR